MSFEAPKYLSEWASNLRNRPIAWEAYVRSGLVTDSEVKKIKAIDKAGKDKRTTVVEKDAGSYVQLLLGQDGVLKRSADKGRVDVIQHVLVLMGDLLQDVPSFTNSLLALASPYYQLLSLLTHADESIPLLSSLIITALLSTSLVASPKPTRETKDALIQFYHYLAKLSKSQEPNHQDLAIQYYISLLRTSFSRQAFWDLKEETVAPIVAILEAAASGSGNGSDRSSIITGITMGSAMVQGGVPLQSLYHVLLVVWELTFEEVVTEEFNPKYDIIPAITDILRSSPKEKITRVCLASFNNLATKYPSVNLPPLLLSNVLQYLQTLSSRMTSTSDPDLSADLQELIQSLETFQSSQTTLSSYRLEILNGHLRWSPPHRNEGFWKKYSREILEDTELVKALARALGTSADKTVLAVAANDVGVLVREVPGSRKKWEGLGVKNRVMELMGDGDAEVRYEALKAVQGFMASAFST
ncbi:H(+)-transporting V1 sector ATPase subunit H [Rhizina undulata]